MSNKNVVGKFIIVNDLSFTDFMKDENCDISLYDTEEEACNTCGMYEFENVLVLEIKHNHVEDDVKPYSNKNKPIHSDNDLIEKMCLQYDHNFSTMNTHDRNALRNMCSGWLKAYEIVKFNDSLNEKN